jgi:hypothetical protein
MASLEATSSGHVEVYQNSVTRDRETVGVVRVVVVFSLSKASE